MAERSSLDRARDLIGGILEWIRQWISPPWFSTRTNDSDQEFRDRVRELMETPERRSKLNLRLDIRGGAPTTAFEERIELSGTGEIDIVVSDDLERKPVGEFSGELGAVDLEDFFELIGASLDDLIPPSEASFPPDAPVGKVTFEIDGEEESYYFHAREAYDKISEDEESVIPRTEPTTPENQTPISNLLARTDQLERNLLGGDQ